jgi:hypothetical protein
MKKIFILLIGLTCLSACYNNQKQSVSNKQSETSSQKQLEEEGWQLDTPNGGDLSKEYGVTPIKGLQDNYFDITVGKGCSVAIKIMDTATNRCIRYVYVPEGQTVTINEIPQGIYYLKLAYGSDWMTYKTDSVTIGKFTRNAFYERSVNAYNFGRKNSMDFVNFNLRINVVQGNVENNFETQPIKEQEFLMN